VAEGSKTAHPCHKIQSKPSTGEGGGQRRRWEKEGASPEGEARGIVRCDRRGLESLVKIVDSNGVARVERWYGYFTDFEGGTRGSSGTTAACGRTLRGGVFPGRGGASGQGVSHHVDALVPGVGEVGIGRTALGPSSGTSSEVDVRSASRGGIGLVARAASRGLVYRSMDSSPCSGVDPGSDRSSVSSRTRLASSSGHGLVAATTDDTGSREG